MSRRPGEGWAGFAERAADAFGLVLLLVVLLYILTSLVAYDGWEAVLISFVVCLCATVALISAEAPAAVVRTAAGVSAAVVVFAIVTAAGGGHRWAGVAALIGAALLAAAALRVLGTVLTEREVGFRTILGAISVYVMLGLLFTFVYAGLDRVQSGHFFQEATQTGDYVYFSITTLTTTGYGNLIPGGQPGRMLSGLEMLTGQIFLVTLIAGLVSLWRPGAARQGRASR
jgi:Ion channel